jgi:hypothetical protein
MARSFEVRRHADGALDLDYYRRKAGRLRRAAQRRLWRRLWALIGYPMTAQRQAARSPAKSSRAAGVA